LDGVDRLPLYRGLLLESLSELSERDLQARVVEPLLRAMGFTHVRDTSGPSEQGKDLVAVKVEFGLSKLYAIQIKKLRVSGRHSSPQSLHSLLLQLEQVFSEPVMDPTTLELRLPDRCLFVTPFEVSKAAFDSARGRMRGLVQREIAVVDGPLLADQIMQYLPDALAHVSAETRYRIRLAEAANLVRESQALGACGDLTIANLYVDPTLGSGAWNLQAIAAGRVAPHDSCVALVHPRDVEEFDSACAQALPSKRSILWIPPRADHVQQSKILAANSMLKAEQDAARKRVRELDAMRTNPPEARRLRDRLSFLEESRVAEIDIRPVWRSLARQSRSYCELMREHSKASRLRLTDAVRKCIALYTTIDAIAGTVLAQANWYSLYDASNLGAYPEETFRPSDLLNIKHAVFLTGGPGSGKTTLVRHLARETAQGGRDELPVLLYLVRARGIVSEDTLLQRCKEELAHQGLHTTTDDLRARAEKGRLRLLLDGLDEVGSDAPSCYRAIREFASLFPDCPVVLTARDTIEYEPWHEALSLHLAAFDDSQLCGFVERWFTAQPSSKQGLLTWLDENQKMRDAARTPLILALLCVLFEVGHDLPSTQVELYDRRLELLLGRWDQAKGVIPLQPDLRQRYELFLMHLAFSLHKAETRATAYRLAVREARQVAFPPKTASAGDVVLDCIHRGILFREPGDSLSFGHMTYQEFLAARCLARENDVQFVWEHLSLPWWRGVVDFYAGLRGEVNSLLECYLGKRTRGRTRERLQELLNHAPATSPDLIEKLRA
jgi:hypothetical protein